MSMIKSSIPPGKTAGDLAKERNKLEVSRRIDQVSPAKKLDEKNKKLEDFIRFTTNIVDASRSLELSLKGFLWFLGVAQSILKE